MSSNRLNNIIKTIETASRGEDVRDAIIDALRSLSEASGSGIDTRLDLQSTNPVQNKVLAQKFAISDPPETIFVSNIANF